MFSLQGHHSNTVRPHANMSSDGITSAPCVGVIVFAHDEEPETPTKVSVLLQKTLKVGFAIRTLPC